VKKGADDGPDYRKKCPKMVESEYMKPDIDAAEIDTMIRENIGLVTLCLRPYRNGARWRNVEELEACALEGLWIAAKSYQPERGPFSTWACVIIKRRIQRDINHWARKKRAGDNSTLSLSAPVDGDMELGDSIADDAPGPEALALARVAAAVALDACDDRARQIFRASAAGFTLQEIGAGMGLSGERVRQLAVKARQELPAALATH
jgi:RNA polymerase sigma factor (sigma-70 family)